MSIPEALKGAQAELARLHSPIDKLTRIAIYARIITAELASTFAILPYGVRAASLHRSLPNAHAPGHQGELSIARGLRYGPKERNTIDLYLPSNTQLLSGSLQGDDSSAGDQQQQSIQDPVHPVVLFCHGGIWATGASWHYAPMATRLAQAGVITGVMQYSLYPEALVPEMVDEVSSALTWTLDHVSAYGGNAENVTLVGHSAGAQLCALTLLKRLEDEETTGQSSATKMPRRFVGLAGVFDIAQHYEYEKGRDVHELSTMKRAMGGFEGFPAGSPSVVLRSLVAGRDQVTKESYSLDKRYIKGQVVTEDTIIPPVKEPPTPLTAAPLSTISPAHLKANFPSTLFQASKSDITVPCYQSVDMHRVLRRTGVDSEVILYDNVGHGDFVVGWRPLASPLTEAREKAIAGLPDYASDLVRVLLRDIDIVS